MATIRRQLSQIVATGATLSPLTEPEAWMTSALCAQVDPEMFFPEKGGSTREAKSVCLRCEVRDDCLQYALQHEERFGVWGGISERDRRRLAAGQTLPVSGPVDCPTCGKTFPNKRSLASHRNIVHTTTQREAS